MTDSQMTREGLILQIAGELAQSDANAASPTTRGYVAALYAEAVAIVDGKWAPDTSEVITSQLQAAKARIAPHQTNYDPFAS